MKTKALFLALMFALPLAGRAQTNDITDFLRQSFLTSSSNNWILQIDDTFLSSDEFRNGFIEFVSNIPPEQLSGSITDTTLKKQYLESYIGQYAILMKAIEEGVFDSSQMQTYFRAAVLQAVFQIYFQWLMVRDRPDFTPTTDEMNAFYQQNLQQIVSLGLTSDQIRALIMQQLTEQKMQMWMKQQLDVVKEQYRIRRNSTKLRSLGFE